MIRKIEDEEAAQWLWIGYRKARLTTRFGGVAPYSEGEAR